MAQEFRFPSLGTNLVEGDIVSWLVEVGERVEVDQPLVEVETEKSITEVPSPYAGVVLRHGAAVGESIRVGEILVVIGEPEEADVAPPVIDESDAADETTAAARSRGRIRATPMVRRMARQLGIDLARVSGSGPGQKIVRADLEAHAALPPADSAHDASTAPAGVGDERVRMSKLRRTIAERMLRSWREIPHFHTRDRIDASRLLAVREALKAELDQPIPLEALVIRALIPALRAFPQFNAVVDRDDLVLRRRYDIGFAVATDGGLIVPVVHASDKLRLPELAEHIVTLAERARRRDLDAEALASATFTVSNVGAVGGSGDGSGTPLIPVGTTAILSIGRAREQPLVRDNEVVIGPMISLDLACDHRAIDGAENRRFMSQLMRYLQEPALLLTETGT